MAFLDSRTSRGKKYWSIVESRRINGKPRNFILEYLGTAQSLLERLGNDNEITIKSYSHGDTSALLNVADELNIIDVINKYLPSGKRPVRDNCTVGSSILLAAIGRACRPTSKDGWYDWSKTTSLEYVSKQSLKKLDSRHFWKQMEELPIEIIPQIEEEIISSLISKYDIKLDTLLFDTTNFFTFIDSVNERCDLPARGKNKQKRTDLRQVGMGLLVSREDQFPLFHKTYQGNKNDSKLFKEVFQELSVRIKSIANELSDVTIVFDKGNNSKDNFKMIDETDDMFYVGGLVSSHFKDLIKEANKNFQMMKINNDDVPVYRLKRDVWGEQRTCVVTVSDQLKEGQIRGIEQHLAKKFKQLESLKQQLENPKKRKEFDKEDLKERLISIIKGQFINDILKYDFIQLKGGDYSFTYYIDSDAFNYLKENILGRKIVVSNRHEWSSEEILLAYRGQAKVEYAFRNLKNPFHLAVRPQYHWTDQKIEVHFFICIIGYLLSIAAYRKARKEAGYKKNINNFMEELKHIRLSCRTAKKGRKVKYQLETIPRHLTKVIKALNISDENIRTKIKFSGYKSKDR